MIHNPQKTILLYGIPGLVFLSLRAEAEKAGIRCRLVSDSETTLRISQLLSEESFPRRDPQPLPGKFALLAGFEGREREGVSLINRFAGGVIKAVHTPHNDSWQFSSLAAELSAEHRLMTKNK